MPSSKAYLFAAVIALSATTACGPQQTLGIHPTTPSLAETAAPVPEGVEATTPIQVKPSFKVSQPAGIDASLPGRLKELPEVAAVAKVAMSKLTLITPAGPSEISVAAVDPDEFRAMAPEVTAAADFVWRRMRSFELILAHEEYRRLGVAPGSKVGVTTASGVRHMVVGAVAANGVPNLAGGMIGPATARALGIDQANLLLIGIRDDADVKKVGTQLKRRFGDLRFEPAAPPAGHAFMSGQQAERLIGSFSYVANPDGTITQDKAWVSRNIVTRRVPILGSATCHKVMIPQLQRALAEIEAAGLTQHIDKAQYGGCYVPRFIGRDSNRPLSMHAWGLAIDINTVDNPQGAVPKIDMRVVEIFERWGFRWGGRWSPPDGHHFELAALIKT